MILNGVWNVASELFCNWEKKSFDVDYVFEGEDFFGIQGTWGDVNKKIFIINIYARQDGGTKEKKCGRSWKAEKMGLQSNLEHYGWLPLYKGKSERQDMTKKNSS